jgi:serine protease Do
MPGFVMPDFEWPAMPQVMAFGPDGDFSTAFRSARPRLGVSVRTDQDDGFDAQGARVAGVMDDGPADEAGIREGDVITSVDGRSLFDQLADDVEEDFDLDASIPVQRLLAIARELEPGDPVEVEYVRDGQPMTATVEVRDLAAMWGAWADDFTTQLRPRVERFQREFRPEMERFRQELGPQLDGVRELVIATAGSTARYGLSLIELSPGLGTYFGTDRGVLVTDVEEDSSLGLRPGDVILRIGDREVDTPSRVLRILRTYDDEESVSFRVRREGSEIDVLGRLAG